jgi:serine-type D-Ala-D-Ala carboxypeptidase (penicillin-binding protein 5/6)
MPGSVPTRAAAVDIGKQSPVPGRSSPAASSEALGSPSSMYPSTPGRQSTSPAASAIPASAPLPTDLAWPDAAQSVLGVAGSGRLDEHGSQQSVPIASIAKVMTAYVVLTDHPLPVGADGPSITVTAQDAADYEFDVSDGQSAVEVRIGEQLTERQALEELLLRSANNIAFLLARWDAGSVPGFLDRMNTTAAGLGLTRTVYTDPSGLDATTVSTAADQATLAETALEVPAFAALVDTASASVPLAGTIVNYNTLLGVDGIVGVKTGYTRYAGGTMIFAAWTADAGRRILIVGAFLGLPGPYATVLGQTLDAADRLVLSAEQALARG